jgi:hypothetical protein
MRVMRSTTPARRSPRSSQILRALPRLEELETRVVPYSLSGDAWPNPQLITLSFVPDGTILGGTVGGYVYSNMFATFNAKWGTSTWETQILKAAQLWAQQTNINFAVIPDSGATIGSGNYQQGDPTMGDIRIGGFNFNATYLAWAFMPPPVNNFSVAGDVQFNTAQPFNINSAYDLETVAAHEIGHALGLYHSTLNAAEMYGAYNATKQSLNSDDIAGIRAIYSSGNARSYDSFGGSNNSFSTAANLTGVIDENGNVLENPLDIANTSFKEYFTITAPANTNGNMTVTVQSSGLSLLAPTLTIYNSSQTQIGYVSGAGQYGTTLTLNITGVSANQQFYIKVAGADTSAFGTGNYGMTISFAGITPPAITSPNTQVLNGNPTHGGGGQYDTRGQDTAWDTFGQNDDAPVVPKATIGAQNALSIATLGRGAAARDQLLSSASITNENATEFPAAAFNAVLLSPAASNAAFNVVAYVSNLGRVESGSGSNSLEAGSVDSQSQQPAAPADEIIDSPPISPDRNESASPPASVVGVSWNQACDACFADEFVIDDSNDMSNSVLMADQDGVSAMVEPASAVAMLALFGGWWSARPEQPDRSVRRFVRL